MRWRGPIRQPVPAAGTNKASPAPGLTRTAKNRPTGIRESPAPGQRDETGADRKASGYTHRSFRPDAVRYMSVTTATHRPTVTRADTRRDKTKTAELRDLQERVTAHLAAIPASWGVDSDGVTGPEAGRAGDAAVLPAAERLDEIPGLGREAAAALIAEIGLDMSRFPSPQALVSWAGLTPTARQSGPRKGRGKKGRGNTYAKQIAVLAAYAAANTDTFLGERFRRLAARPGGGGRKKAGCAVGRSVLIIVWHLLNDPAARYRDLGPGWHARHTDRSRKARNAQRQLEALGYDVIITLREDAA
jgi:Transposase IS116/IS110/IS902 family